MRADHHTRPRRLAAVQLLLLVLLLSGAPALARQSPSKADARADVDFVCALVASKYAYYAGRRDSWARACAHTRKTATQTKTRGQALDLIEHLLDALYDAHVSLGVNSAHSPRLVPSGADIWLAETAGTVMVTAVRTKSAAARAGIRPGDHLLAINDVPIRSAATRRAQTAPGKARPAQWAWALNAVAAGVRGKPRDFVLERAGKTRLLHLGDPEPRPEGDPVTARMIDDGIGYLRFNNSLGDSGTVKAFDAALAGLRGAKGWILDLRDTPSGGNTGVAEPILGRFITRAQPYQLTVYPGRTPQPRLVRPRGPWTVKGPVAVLVGRWTGSMGEGMAIGLDGMKRALVMGSPMAGLAGGTQTFTLPWSGFPLHLPTYDLRHVDGTPRYLWRPPVMLVADNGNGPDLALERAVKAIAAQQHTAGLKPR